MRETKSAWREKVKYPQAEDQLFTINSPQEWRGNTPLAYTVRDREAIGILSIPADIAALEPIDEEKEAKETGGNLPLHQVLEEMKPRTHI